MSSPVPLLRPPIPGGNRAGSGTRVPRLGLSIPASPSQKAVSSEGNEPPTTMPSLGPPRARPAPPQLRLATPLGSSATPQERPAQTHGGGAAQGSAGDGSANGSRPGSFGMLEGRPEVPSSASSNGQSGRGAGGTPDPASAISVYSDRGGDGRASSVERGRDRRGSEVVLPDLARLNVQKGRALDADDLDDDGWMAASKAGMIEELGTLGEGAGGAVTKCKLKAGGTVFALKVCAVVWCRWAWWW